MSESGKTSEYSREIPAFFGPSTKQSLVSFVFLRLYNFPRLWPSRERRQPRKIWWSACKKLGCNQEGTLGPWSKKLHSQSLSAAAGRSFSTHLLPFPSPFIFRFILTAFGSWPQLLRCLPVHSIEKIRDIYGLQGARLLSWTIVIIGLF